MDWLIDMEEIGILNSVDSLVMDWDNDIEDVGNLNNADILEIIALDANEDEIDL